MIDEALHVRLEDWAFWVRDRGGHGYRVRSVEGRYKTPPGSGERPPVTPRKVDSDDAAMIERAISHPEFPRQARDLLVGWYVHLANMHQLCRKCGIGKGQYDERMGWAGRVLRNRLDKREKLSTMSANNSTSTDPVSIPCHEAGIPLSERKEAHQA